MLKRYQISEGRFCDGTAESCPIQVYVNPDDAEKRFLVNELKLDEHTLASSLDPDELARLEFEPEHVAVIVKRPRSYSAEDLYLFRVSSMGLFLFKDKLVIVSGEDVQPWRDGNSCASPRCPTCCCASSTAPPCTTSSTCGSSTRSRTNWRGRCRQPWRTSTSSTCSPSRKEWSTTTTPSTRTES